MFIVKPVTEPILENGCSVNSDCPEYTACRNRLCINPCAYDDPCAPSAFCKVTQHQAICTCPDGFAGTPEISCERRKYCKYVHLMSVMSLVECFDVYKIINVLC